MESNFDSEIYAGIVTYNPDLQRLTENLDAVTKQVRRVVVVDNGSENIDRIRTLVEKYQNLGIISNKKNLGIAKALDQIMRVSEKHGAEWVLTLDQDSVIYDGLVDEYRKYLNIPDVGMFTCCFQDRNADGIETKKNSESIDIVEVDRCITSGCLTNVLVWKEAGGYDEQMFIDYVDYDLCLTMRELGYHIKRINYIGLLHELGQSEDVNIFGVNTTVWNHSSFRKYYIVRNRVYYIIKHWDYIDKKREIISLIRFPIKTLIFEKNKLEKLKSMIHGFLDAQKLCGKLKYKKGSVYYGTDNSTERS